MSVRFYFKYFSGMLHAGIGHTTLTKLMTALNITSARLGTLKKHERHVGNALEKVAKESCKSAIRLEKDKRYLYQ